MFEDMILGRIFGSKGEVTEDWEELYKEEHHNLHLSPNTVIVKSRQMRMAAVQGPNRHLRT
jgi:hypothetical protein